MVTVLVVDDQVLIRAGLAALIRAAPGLEVVGEAATGEEAVDLAAELRPDVVLMDIRLPGISGITATERILAAGGSPVPKVLILTTFDVDEYVYNALRLGASGFLLKDTPPERLISAVHTVAGGDVLLAPNAVRRLVEAFGAPAARPRTEPGTRPEPLAPLTGREVEVLHLVGQAMSNRQIAEVLSLSEATVKTHLNRLMSKLHLTSRAQAVVLAYDCGLIEPAGRGTPQPRKN
ncbi:response regulator transcription factor [Planomonospora sp. ID82291]|uniref:response regulator n=1 Tax=Planomonospora sp. ID82291 TaxID=2738136 RepID=UPI0018C3BFDF|nr:response regulator transcription factor [Planomonospora sp. ID82291]MBG0812661.1 response regulator transcription factor [Planomonospora sp. ID82291]